MFIFPEVAYGFQTSKHWLLEGIDFLVEGCSLVLSSNMSAIFLSGCLTYKQVFSSSLRLLIHEEHPTTHYFVIFYVDQSFLKRDLTCCKNDYPGFFCQKAVHNFQARWAVPSKLQALNLCYLKVWFHIKNNRLSNLYFETYANVKSLSSFAQKAVPKISQPVNFRWEHLLWATAREVLFIHVQIFIH